MGWTWECNVKRLYLSFYKYQKNLQRQDIGHFVWNSLAKVTFLLLLAFFRPTAHIILEQPTSSWLYKQKVFLEIIQRYNLKKILTYQGCWGGWLLKGTHLMTTLPSLQSMARKATNEVREKHRRRVAKMNHKRISKGLSPKVFYRKLTNGTFHGTKQLAETAFYPSSFVIDIFRCWQRHRCGLQWNNCPIPENQGPKHA